MAYERDAGALSGQWSGRRLAVGIRKEIESGVL